MADVKGESAYNDDLANMVTDLKTRACSAQRRRSACLCRRSPTPKVILPLIVQKAGGGYLYTTDLAAIRHRANG
jgi:arginyl-tRNA synthetase